MSQCKLHTKKTWTTPWPYCSNATVLLIELSCLPQYIWNLMLYYVFIADALLQFIPRSFWFNHMKPKYFMIYQFNFISFLINLYFCNTFQNSENRKIIFVSEMFFKIIISIKSVFKDRIWPEDLSLSANSCWVSFQKELNLFRMSAETQNRL